MSGYTDEEGRPDTRADRRVPDRWPTQRQRSDVTGGHRGVPLVDVARRRGGARVNHRDNAVGSDDDA